MRFTAIARFIPLRRFQGKMVGKSTNQDWKVIYPSDAGKDRRWPPGRE